MLGVARVMGDSTLLPNGKILLHGGAQVRVGATGRCVCGEDEAGPEGRGASACCLAWLDSRVHGAPSDKRMQTARSTHAYLTYIMPTRYACAQTYMLTYDGTPATPHLSEQMGHANAGPAATKANFQSLMYDPYKPAGQRYSKMDFAPIARVYHSANCLDVTGKVLVAGEAG